MAQTRIDALTFEIFVADLLERYDLEVVRSPLGRDPGYDLRVVSPSSSALVEVKLYVTLQVSSAVLRQGFSRLRDVMDRDDIHRGIFVTNAKIRDSAKREAKALGIIVYDFDVLYRLVSPHPDLVDRFENILQDSFIYRSEPLPPPDPEAPVEFVDPPSRTRDASAPLQNQLREEGERLCIKLKATKSGRRNKAATIFESICVECLNYLFDDDFIGWNTQQGTHERLHRYDLIARVASQNDFWNLMIADHRARYIIFEFKNYREKISQTQIYTTEKYLLPQAMRSASIIISRSGFNDNAFRVAAGALRESGKIILGLDVEDMCEMLHLKDKGGDPAEVVGRKLDQLLMGLER